MSDYTTQVRWLRSSNYDFGMKNYPIFDENYRNTLNTKILDHYEFREIGFETAGLFKFYLNRTLNEIMPLYNKMYKLILEDKNLFNNINIKEEYTKQNDGKSTNISEGKNNQFQNSENNTNSEHNDKTRNVQSTTPQALLSMKSIENEVYASVANIDKSEGTDISKTDASIEIAGNSELSATVNAENTETYLKSLSGNSGLKYNYEVLYELKDKLFDIDTLIINDLSNLFMLIY